MAFRRPLYYTNGNLTEMSDGIISGITSQAFWEFINNPSVTLSVWGSGGNLGTLYDTRMQAGASSTSTTDYPAETTTAEPSSVSVGYSRLQQDVSAPGIIDTNNIKYPAYYDGANIRAMSMQDLFDTFIYTAMTWIVRSDELYTISQSGGFGGYNLQSWTPVFSDTRADTGAYTAEGIGETLDQPYTVANFYLHRRAGSSVSYTTPVCINTNGNLYQTSEAGFNPTLSESIRYVAAHQPGYRLRYGFNTAGNNNGSGMTDTRLDGGGAYTQRFVDGDDYRAQEFPNGNAQTISTYYLRSRLE